MGNYSLKSCEKLINKYVVDYNGIATTLDEGVLGLGTVILHNAKGKKTIIIKEFYINAWSSGHTIRKYNKIPKKYLKLIDNV